MLKNVALVTLVTLAIFGSFVWLWNPDYYQLKPWAKDNSSQWSAWIRDRNFRIGHNLRVGEDVSLAHREWGGAGFVYTQWFAYPRAGYPIPKPLGYYPGWKVSLPLWFVVLAFLAYPVVIFRRGPVRRRYRIRRGLCVTCGYNLTGNLSGICSECAQRISAVDSSTESSGQAETD